MVRVTNLLFATVPVFCRRVEVTEHDIPSEKVNHGLELLQELKENPEDIHLQQEYRDLIGEKEWLEPRIFLETGMTSSQEPIALGPLAQPGTVFTMVEKALSVEEATSLGRSFQSDGVTEDNVLEAASTAARVAGRVMVNRRDYVVEREGGNSEYVIDGAMASLHSRMFVKVAGEENPQFILRSAFNYYNPLANNFGQYVYRVASCIRPSHGECTEGDILYTITQDRYGRGFRWKHEEYRVYTGTGGCSTTGHGMRSCNQDLQIMYSLKHDGVANVYKGNIVSINTNGERGTAMQDGRRVRVGADELESMKVAVSTQSSGPQIPRELSWGARMAVGPIYGLGQDVAQATIWTDAYSLSFEGGGGPVDEVLVSLLVAVQDLTHDLED